MSSGLPLLESQLATAGVPGSSVVAIGTFDGVHLGHQYLVREVVKSARALGATPVILTFQPRPAEVLHPDVSPRYLTSLPERERLLREAGAERVVVLPFTRELSQISAADFARVLSERLRMRELIGGPDLALGRAREGTPEVLARLGQQLGFTVRVVSGLTLDGEAIRSSLIHRLLQEGDIDKVACYLGRLFAVSGTVVHGEGRGRTIGVPTANVAVPSGFALPANGVYAVRAEVNGRSYGGAANLGTRPTFNGEDRSLEVHLLDFEGDIYGAPIRIEFRSRLRAEQRFDTVNELVQQIRADVANARRILTESDAESH